MSEDRSSPAAAHLPKFPSGHRSVADAVGEKLRAVYGGVLSEPVPAQLSDLVRKLAKTGRENEGELRSRNERLNQLLEEKELLVREMNHRVKNSLQLVSSIIGLQLDDLRDPEAAARLRDAQARVAAIARAHDRLYAGSGIDSIEVGPYLEDVFSDVARMVSLREGDTDFRTGVGDRTLPADTVMPVAMIMCELVTNAARHGGGAGRPIGVSLEVDDDQFRLAVAGPPDGAVPKAGVDLQMAHALAGQIGSVLLFEPLADGLRTSITFHG